MVFTAFCGRALWHALYRALCVHCTCTVQNTVCAILLLEAWRHILCLCVALKMNVSLDWGCGTCKREFVQACVCTSINEKTNLLRLGLVGSSFEDESVFGLRLWQVQKVVCSSLCLHIRKPKNLCRTESGEAHSQLQTCYPPNKDPTDLFFSFMDVQTQAWTNSLLHCQNPNSNTLSSSELLPTNKEATLQHLLRTWAKIGDQSCVPCMVH